MNKPARDLKPVATVEAPVTLTSSAPVVAPQSNVVALVQPVGFDWAGRDFSSKDAVLAAAAELSGMTAGLIKQAATRKLDVGQLVFRATGKGAIVAKETAGKLTVKQVYDHFSATTSKDEPAVSKTQSVSKLKVFHDLAKVNQDPAGLWKMVERVSELASGSKLEACLKVARVAIKEKAILGDNRITEILNAVAPVKDEDATLKALEKIVADMGKKIEDEAFILVSDYFAKIKDAAEAQLAAYKAVAPTKEEVKPVAVVRNFDF